MTNKEYITKFKNAIKKLDDLRFEYGETNKLFSVNDHIKNEQFIFKIYDIQFYSNIGVSFCGDEILVPDISYYCKKINIRTGKIKNVSFHDNAVSNYTKLSKKEIRDYREKLYAKKDFYVLINNVGNIKFGISKDVEKRIKSLKFASGLDIKILKVIKNKPELESYFKNKFKKLQLNGEWFKDSIEIRKELSKY